jgi:hypothetical protein
MRKRPGNACRSDTCYSFAGSAIATAALTTQHSRDSRVQYSAVRKYGSVFFGASEYPWQHVKKTTAAAR